MDALKCKLHDYAHSYTVCPVCSHQYCARHWPACPSKARHAEIGETPVPTFEQAATPEHG